jgi:hypothetical protein
VAEKQYWITDPRGDYALVTGTEQRDVWTKVRGWSESGEPGPADRVHLVHTEVGHGGPLLYESLAVGFADGQWSPGPPPEPVDVTKDPALRDQPAEPPKPKPAPSGGGEKSRE